METISDGATANLPAHECLELLRSVTLGRLAVIVNNRPEIFPLNFVVDHGTVVFRSAAGTKLSALAGSSATAFEADGHCADSTVWSVVISGYLEPLAAFDPATTQLLALYPQQPGSKPRFLRLVPDAITGRRFLAANPEIWRSSLVTGRVQAWE